MGRRHGARGAAHARKLSPEDLQRNCAFHVDQPAQAVQDIAFLELAWRMSERDRGTISSVLNSIGAGERDGKPVIVLQIDPKLTRLAAGLRLDPQLSALEQFALRNVPGRTAGA